MKSKRSRRRRRASLRTELTDTLSRYGLSWRRFWLLLLAPLVIVIAFVLTRPPDAIDAFSAHVHYGWFKRSFIKDHLEKWYVAASTDNGYLHPHLDRTWQPVDPAETSPTIQGGLLFLMSSGYEATREPHYLTAMDRGADFLLRHMHDAQSHHWHRRVDRHGAVLDDSHSARDDAFAIFGLAHVYRMSRQERFRTAAVDSWQAHDSTGLQAARAHARGTRLPDVGEAPFDASTLLHLFAALLTLHEITTDAALREDLEAIAGFVTERLFDADNGRLPLMFGVDWLALPAAGGGYIGLGQQTEWAYLLSHAAEQGVIGNRHLPAAGRLLDGALALGYDTTHGGLYARIGYDGRPLDRLKPAWVQAELLRSLLHFATLRGRDDLWPRFDQSLALVKRDYIDADHGGWLPHARSAQTLAPGADHKGDGAQLTAMHVAEFYREALQLHERRYLAERDTH